MKRETLETTKTRLEVASSRLAGLHEGKAPWNSPRELRQFWAIARQACMTKDNVHDAIRVRFAGKERMHDLTRGEFVRLVGDLARKASSNSALDAYFIGRAVQLPWGRIRWLQRQIGWTDSHLINFIKTIARIDDIRWLSVDKTRAVITGMGKIMRTAKTSDGRRTMDEGRRNAE